MALRCLDVELHDVPRPEIYAAPVSRAFLDKASCHLIFKPTEWIRLLKRVWNIAWVIWEFDELTGRQTSGPHHPFTDIRRMLTIPHEIWALCEFTRRLFRAAGTLNVHCIPAPIVVSRMAEPFRFPEIPPDLCKRHIEMTPLCKIEVTHPRVLGSREVRRGGVVDEQTGVQPS